MNRPGWDSAQLYREVRRLRRLSLASHGLAFLCGAAFVSFLPQLVAAAAKAWLS